MASALHFHWRKQGNGTEVNERGTIERYSFCPFVAHRLCDLLSIDSFNRGLRVYRVFLLGLIAFPLSRLRFFAGNCGMGENFVLDFAVYLHTVVQRWWLELIVKVRN